MERWRNKVAVVTGASSGIGAAVTKDLVKAGLVTVGLARRVERVEALREDLPEDVKNNLHAAKCDVTKEDEVVKTFNWIKDKFGGVDILINNAGVLILTALVSPDNSEAIRNMVDTNVMGIVYCTREAFNSMKERQSDGHVVLVNSVDGHKVPVLSSEFPSFNIYPATKFAVTAMAETYRQEFRINGTKVKITSISPGVVDTDIFPAAVEDLVKSRMPMLKSEDVSDAIMYAIATPPHVQIHELIIKPVGEIY